jgi:hypothetical protein
LRGLSWGSEEKGGKEEEKKEAFSRVRIGYFYKQLW